VISLLARRRRYLYVHARLPLPPFSEWAKIAAEKPSTRGVENPGPLPRSLASRKREISEKKWAEARSWAGGRISKAKYRVAKSQKPDSEVANSTKRLASRFYQLNTGDARIGQYLHWDNDRPDDQCWWCKCPSQTRNHLFSVPGMEGAAKGALGGGAEGDGKVEEPVEDPGPTCREKVRKSSAGLPHRSGCRKAGATCGRRRRREPDVRIGAPRAQGAGTGTGGRGGGAGCCGRLGHRRGTTAILTHTLLHGIDRRGVGGRGALSFISFPLSSSLGAFISFLATGQAGGQREACNEPPLHGLRTGKPGKMYAAIIYRGRMLV